MSEKLQIPHVKAGNIFGTAFKSMAESDDSTSAATMTNAGDDSGHEMELPSEILHPRSFILQNPLPMTAPLTDHPTHHFHHHHGESIVGDNNAIMNSSQISSLSNDSAKLMPSISGGRAFEGNATTMISPMSAMTGLGSDAVGGKIGGSVKHLAAQQIVGKSCRFPKLEECAHFHYERVQLGPLSVRLVDDRSELNNSTASQSIGGDIANGPIASTATASVSGPASARTFSPLNCSFIIRVVPYRCDSFLIKRSFENMQMLDEMLHRCVYDRKISGLKDLKLMESTFKNDDDVEYAVAKYLERFSKIASDSLTCGPILTWLHLDNKGRRLPLADSDTMRCINTPAVGAAYGVRRYQAQASDEISIEVGDMISVIDMPSPAESIWWRGKKSHLQKSQYEVGFFPQSCVATIGDKVPRNFPMPAPLVGQVDVSPTKPVLRKHGKLIAFFRSFILSRPSRRSLKQSGIYRERVFSCDLSEHLLNSGHEIPMVLKCCSKFIEDHGIIDGIYRLSGITSNIQRLRRAFDEECDPDLGNPEMKQDIHAVSSLLKMYFRELPNPLCTYQLYDNFVEAIQAKSESEDRLRLMRETVLKLPPPHYRTLKFLAEHLHKISQHSERTGMTDKNLAIVWAPNLLRSPALESGGVAALRGVGIQAVVTEYLIRNCQQIFNESDDSNARLSFIAPASDLRLDSLTDCDSLLVEQREHDQTMALVERPKSLSAGAAKLISLEEAQERHSRTDGFDVNRPSLPINMAPPTNTANIGSYIEVGGGPSSLPDKYHTVLPMPQKRKTHSWKSLFTRNQRPGPGITSELKLDAIEGEGGSTADVLHKGSPHVTFADSETMATGKPLAGGGSSASGAVSKGTLLKQEKPKSIELFETSRSLTGGDSMKTMESYVRSNSIDSLRTSGHSRSVSHDSYFDLLQSPQRGNLTTCPSRELSELGLNFDREEPEMRIFSESESLVSSPRVGKENIPPSSATNSRRILRARPEEFSSQANSVNPSPKKQPRLNLSAAPSSQPPDVQQGAGKEEDCSAHDEHNQPNHQQQQQQQQQQHHHHHHNHTANEEFCCKRYKLEDQLSDIQFIDCSTPEHVAANMPPPSYAGVQIQPNMKLTVAGNSLAVQDSPRRSIVVNRGAGAEQWAEGGGNLSHDLATNDSKVRYSYPTTQLGSKRKEYGGGGGGKTTGNADRFSYPNLKCTTKVQMRQERPRKMDAGHPPVYVNDYHDREGMNKLHLPKNALDLMRHKRQSQNYGGDSGDCCSDMDRNDIDPAKVSVTPSSPMHSPRYSLLVAETSSEGSSALNTPQGDLDPLMITSTLSVWSGLSGASSGEHARQHKIPFAADEGSAACYGIRTSHESLDSSLNSCSHANGNSNANATRQETRDMSALKRELSLDLNPLNSKLAYDHLDAAASSRAAAAKHSVMASPNSIVTDNTSQSVTPSEFGYQHLHRQLSMRSLIETEENSPAYEEYESLSKSLMAPQLQQRKIASPIKSTISITYNVKGNKDEISKVTQPNSLLETSFDENTIYEQVKLYRDSVTEVNQLLTNDPARTPTKCNRNELKAETAAEENNIDHSPLSGPDSGQEHKCDLLEKNGGSPRSLALCETNNDSLREEEKLLYENVELRQPKCSVYENISGEEMKSAAVENDRSAALALDLDSLDSVQIMDNAKDTSPNLQCLEQHEEATAAALYVARKSPSNFSVKELATKFESSPVEQLPMFDFGGRSSIKKPQVVVGYKTEKKSSQKSGQAEAGVKTRSSQSHCQAPQAANSLPSPQPPPRHHVAASPSLAQTSSTCLNAGQTQRLTKSQQQITRSLDENAFVREFGSRYLYDLSAKSTQQLPELTEVASRRKSFDFMRPKTLNPPKRLPGMRIAEEVCQRGDEASSLQFDLSKDNLTSGDRRSATGDCEHGSAELKITPTTENRISLIQNNVGMPIADLSNSNLNLSTSSLRALSGVKLDRERIDKIKEERRQQLTQKYGSESLKSRSKVDLHCSSKEDTVKANVDALRVKSKSRGDVCNMTKGDIDNVKDYQRSSSITSGSTSTGSESCLTTTHRVRSISDEKNQNNYEGSIGGCGGGGGGGGVAAAAAAAGGNSNVTDFTTAGSNSGSGGRKEFSVARATAQKFERKNHHEFSGGSAAVVIPGARVELSRDRSGDLSATVTATASLATSAANSNNLLSGSRSSLSSTREKISPQYSIKDVTAMFESRSQNLQ